MDINDKRFIESLSKVNDLVQSGCKLVSNEVLLTFQCKQEQLRENIEKIKEKERVLSIGIVGAVKSGKSTFLNGLIFEGEEILPKAPTPMTAALTKIGYSQDDYANIIFYSRAEWEKISEIAGKYEEQINIHFNNAIKKFEVEQSSTQNYGGPMRVPPTKEKIESEFKSTMPVEYVSCKELISMVNPEISIEKFLGEKETIKLATEENNFINSLENYIGVGGDFTPIVKHTEIYSRNPMLEGFEIVDTPGLDDPILSRSETTKKFLINCDVIFLLSYAGQFLTNEDISLIRKVLPNEGINQAILIGSKFDSGILDYPNRKATFEEAFKGSRRKYIDSAKRNFEVYISQKDCPAIIKNIEKSLPPKFISGIMYSIAKKKEKSEALNEEEQHMINQFNKHFIDFDDSIEELYNFSGIPNIKKQVFDKLRSSKEILIQERIDSLIKSQASKFLVLLEDINISAKKNLGDINEYDYEELQKKKKKILTNLDSTRRNIKNQFEKSAVNAKKALREMSILIGEEVSNNLEINIGNDTRYELRTESSGFLGLMKHEFRDTIKFKTAQVSDVIENIRNYYHKSQRTINEEFKNIIEIDRLKTNVKKTVIAAFDLTDKNFNEDDIIKPLEIQLQKISIPEISMDIEEYDEMIFQEFTEGMIENDKIANLLTKQQIVIQKLCAKMQVELNKSAEEIEIMLNKQAAQFIDGIEMQVLRNIDLIQKLLDDKEQSIKELKDYIDLIVVCKNIINEFEV